MKNLKLLFLSFATVLLICSCSKDDDNDSASIEGKWQITQEGETLQTLTAIENPGSCGTTIIDVKPGGTFTVIGFDYVDSKCVEYSGQGTWVKTNNTLTIKEDEETTAFEVLEITKSTLKLKETDSEGIWITVYKRK